MLENPYEHFLEIDEIRKIFKIWNKTNDNLSNQQILDIISYFFPDVCSEDDKHIHEFVCSLWNKGEQIEYILHEYKKYYIENYLQESYYLVFYFFLSSYCFIYIWIKKNE